MGSTDKTSIQLLTIPETADVLRTSQKTIRRWISGGDLIAHKFGRQWRISQDDLSAFIKLRRQV